jgi:hypothetical protein
MLLAFVDGNVSVYVYVCLYGGVALGRLAIRQPAASMCVTCVWCITCKP